MLEADALHAPAKPMADPQDARVAAQRLHIIDLLRGAMIVLMVLDHTRDFFHYQAIAFSATDLEKTTPALFLTRWITHICAPTFVFLAGVSVYLQRVNGSSGRRLGPFLVTRGLWLIAVEITVVSFAFFLAWPFAFLQVIWAIGVSMILLAAVIRLPQAAVLALGAVIVAGHGLLTPLDPAALGVPQVLWTLALKPGPLAVAPGTVTYPFVPWFGIMCLGYGLGFVFKQEPAARRRSLTALGLGAFALFAVLRTVNLYGDPKPWAAQTSELFTVLSFINVSKYPPSLDYVLLMLGISLPLAAALDRLRGPAANLLLTFGRVPLFAYVLHLYIGRAISLLIGLAMGMPASVFQNPLANREQILALHWGFGLGGTYAFWLLIVALLYPAARWYAGVKRRSSRWWLAYL
ncbi:MULTISPECIES: heparan-alpha-glucosaminide N-acetyltransferase domain-containing protein [Rhodomicrobium]|uniref:DUF1624 domain-containing protein n=1 Tax=Rhodomicrobium TaxID=1068 RepID=UPI000B4BBCF2|nr:MULTISPECIES: heparan-alpha-glucosaminide N-acetyltransferase domain-containing protein [Rhodomicrobium]